MSQNEIDQITQETGRTLRKAIDAARTWMSRQHHSIQGRKLTRQKRDEMARHIESELGAERIAAAWFEKRVADYQYEARTVAAMRGTPGRYNAELTAAGESRLAAMRDRIESTLHSSGLALEHRGQVALALQQVSQDPVADIGRVFHPMSATEAMYTRAAGVESELRVYSRQNSGYQQDSSYAAENAALRARVAELEAAHRDPESGASVGGPATAADSGGQAPRPMSWEQQEAVQAIRRSEIEWRRTNTEVSAEVPGHHVAQACNDAAAQARRAGLSEEQIRSEFAHADANSRSRITVAYHDRDGQLRGVQGYHPTDAEAQAWADRKLTQLTSSKREPQQNNSENASSKGGSNTEQGSNLAEENKHLTQQVAALTAENQQLKGQLSNGKSPNRGQQPGRSASTAKVGDPVEKAKEQIQQMRQFSAGFATQQQAERDAENQRRAESLAQTMNSAIADKDSELVQGQLRHLAQKHGQNKDAAAAEFTQWWVNGNGFQYHSQKLARENAASRGVSSESAGTAEASAGQSALADHRPGSALSDSVTRSNGHDRDGMER